MKNKKLHLHIELFSFFPLGMIFTEIIKERRFTTAHNVIFRLKRTKSLKIEKNK